MSLTASTLENANRKAPHGRKGRRHAEVAHGEPAKAEEARRREAGHHHHERVEGIEPEPAQARIDRTEQKERVGVAERAARRKEDHGVGPADLAGEHVAPMLEDGEGEIAVLLIAEGAVETGE
jgi:hypothetical protein